jgi:hypothetical protein
MDSGLAQRRSSRTWLSTRLAEAAADHAFKLEGINELPFQLKGSFLFSYF